jgi:hypothetical protein
VRRALILIVLLAAPACALDWTPPENTSDAAASDGRKATPYDAGDAARDVNSAAAGDAAVGADGYDLGIAVDARDAGGSACVECGDGRDGRSSTDLNGAEDALPLDGASDGARAATDVATNPLDLITTSLPDATVGTPYALAFSVVGGKEPFTWAVDSGQLPAGIALNPASGALSGTPNTVGTTTFAVRVRDSSSPVQSQARSFTLTVVAPGVLTIPTATLPTAARGQAYAQAVGASGGAVPYSWAVTSGALPAGLTLNAGSGSISGVPTSLGTASFVLQVTDSSSPARTASRAFSIRVVDPLAIATTSLPSAVVGKAYIGALVASGGSGTYQWSVSSGSMPSGLSLDVGTGTISGVPIQAGDVSFGVTAKDAVNTALSAGASLTIAVAVQLAVTTTQLSDGMESIAYTATINASGGRSPRTWTVASGTLPPGIAVDSASGLVHGTPASGSAGLYAFSITVSDASSPPQTVTANLSLRVVATLVITTTTLGNATVGVSYSAVLQSSGGLTPFQWSVASGSLPAGLSLSQTGTLTGRPTIASSYSFTVRVTDASSPQQTALQRLSLTVVRAPVVQTVILPSAVRGQAYAAPLAATGGTTPYRWALKSGSLPTGLTLDAATGQIGGTPTMAETATFVVQVTDASGLQADSASLSLTVAAQLVISTTTLPVGTRNTSYSATLQATGGTSPYSWSVTAGTLPRNLTLQPNTGVLSGTINNRAATGAYPITVQVTDSGSPQQQKTANLTLTIQ